MQIKICIEMELENMQRNNNAENEPPILTNGANTANNYNNGFRVKNVSEINECCENINKRKFSAPIAEAIAKETENVKTEEANKNKTENENVNDEKKRKLENVKIIKTEQNNIDIETVNIKTEADCSDYVENAIPTTSQQATTGIIKLESAETSINSSNDLRIESNCKVVKAVASSTTRDSCRFGIRCLRRNAKHRQEEAHPGDVDYKRPVYPAPPRGTPNCPYGYQCYRRNPAHFQMYAHPSDNIYIPNAFLNPVNMAQDPKNLRLRQRTEQQQLYAAYDDDSDDDFDEPFSDDDDFEYQPSENEENNNSDDLVGDYDDCDRVEE